LTEICNGDDAPTVEAKLARITGNSLGELEAGWRESLGSR